MRNSVLTYFEDTVSKLPDHIAVHDENRSISFYELWTEAQNIAEIIVKEDCNKSPILVYLPKSVSSIAAFLGILYSGNFYTPTDINFPFEKVNSIMKQLEPIRILCNTNSYAFLKENGINEKKLINIDEYDLEKKITKPIGFAYTIDTDPVYTLFTSGSTGVPKGVTISNRSIIDYIDWAKDCYDVNESDKIGNQAPFYFDNSTLDIYLMLSTGATLYIIPEVCFAFPAKLIQYIADYKINMVFWVPSVLISVANMDLLSKVSGLSLSKILFAGEVMPNKHLNYWRKHIPDALYSNLYGPTEITVDCTYYIVDREFKDDEPLPIGVPCRNSDIIILDENDKMVQEAHKIGELCVRGSSLALGYWNAPEKTEEVFVQNPLNTHYPEKIYRTGDMVYYNECHEIIFSGRKDFQIKHMGYRIELGEIENAALGIKELENVCVCYDDNEKQIILFYTTQIALETRVIRKRLLESIPKYMVPTKYMQVDQFPMTANGKIDRKEMFKLIK